jgi:hypothetical protein
MVSKLMLILNAQKEALMGGLPVVTPQNVHSTLVELTKASDFAAPERFWTDPSKIPPKEPPPDPMIEAEKIKSSTTLQKTQAELQAEAQQAEQNRMLEKYKVDTDAQVKLSLADAQIEHSKHLEDQKTANAERLKRVEGEQGAGMEHLKAHLNPKMVEAQTKDRESQQKNDFVQKFMESQQAQTQAILDAVQKLGGPKKVVRGKDGRVESVVPIE